MCLHRSVAVGRGRAGQKKARRGGPWAEEAEASLLGVSVPLHHCLLLLILGHCLPAGSACFPLGDRLADAFDLLGLLAGLGLGLAGDGAIGVEEVAEGAEGRGGGGGHMREVAWCIYEDEKAEADCKPIDEES